MIEPWGWLGRGRRCRTAVSAVRRRSRRWGRAGWSSVCLGAVLLAGCYVHTPVDLDLVPRGAEVRAELSFEELGRLAAQGTSLDGRTVRGRLAEVRAHELQLILPERASSWGTALAGPDVSISRDGLVEVRVRQLHQGRTALALGSAVALTVGLVWYAINANYGPASRREAPRDGDI